MAQPAMVADEPSAPDHAARGSGGPGRFRALEAAARAHAAAAAAERSAAEMFNLLDLEESADSDTLVDAFLIRDARQRARAALASAHTATGDLAAAASRLAIALGRITEYADLHRDARESIATAATPGNAGPAGERL